MPKPAGSTAAIERTTGQRSPWTVRPTSKPCSPCVRGPLCLPQGLAREALHGRDGVVNTMLHLQRGAPLYVAGAPFGNLYVVRSGSLKTVTSDHRGREQVTGVHFAGEPVGLHGISTGTHANSAIALADSSVCIIPYAALTSACSEAAAMQERLRRLLSAQLNRESSQLMALGSLAANERVVAFLLDVSERNGQRGDSPVEFTLDLTRADLGSYLGLTLETVSRCLTALRKQGLIDVQHRMFRILDLEGLRAL